MTASIIERESVTMPSARRKSERITFEVDPPDKAWLREQQRKDGLDMSKRMRAFIDLARTDPQIQEQVLDRAADLAAADIRRQ